MRNSRVLTLVALLCLLAACGDNNPCVSGGQEPDLDSIVFLAAICDYWDTSARCQSLELFESQWALLKTFSVSYQDRPRTLDSIFVRMEESELAPIRDLLENWDDYEPRYFPAPGAHLPAASCVLAHYSDSDTTAISVYPLGQETIPPTPNSLLEAIHSIRDLIRTKLAVL
jgi:hypothetical protein